MQLWLALHLRVLHVSAEVVSNFHVATNTAVPLRGKVRKENRFVLEVDSAANIVKTRVAERDAGVVIVRRDSDSLVERSPGSNLSRKNVRKEDGERTLGNDLQRKEAYVPSSPKIPFGKITRRKQMIAPARSENNEMIALARSENNEMPHVNRMTKLEHSMLVTVIDREAAQTRRIAAGAVADMSKLINDALVQLWTKRETRDLVMLFGWVVAMVLVVFIILGRSSLFGRPSSLSPLSTDQSLRRQGTLASGQTQDTRQPIGMFNQARTSFTQRAQSWGSMIRGSTNPNLSLGGWSRTTARTQTMQSAQRARTRSPSKSRA